MASRNEGVLWRRAGDETVLLDPDSGRCVSLNVTAARLWDGLEEPADIDALAALLTAEWQLAPERARADVSAFLDALVSRGLIRLQAAERSA